MRLKSVRTCWKCRALNFSGSLAQGTIKASCQYGWKLRVNDDGTIRPRIPTKCPKPITRKDKAWADEIYLKGK